jgi:hypothetical protein
MVDKKLIEKYVLVIKEFKRKSFSEKLDKVEIFIIKNKKFPSTYDKESMYYDSALFIRNSIRNYNNNKECLKLPHNRILFENFMKKYINCFPMNKDEIWYSNIKSYEDFYIKNKGKKPVKNKNDINETKLAQWYEDQLKHIRRNTGFTKDILKEIEFNKLQEKYQILNINDKFKSNIINIKKFYTENKKLPYETDSDPNIAYLGKFIQHSKDKYKNNKMNESQKKLWEEFINDDNYKLDSIEDWKLNYNKLKICFDTNNKPKYTSELCKWFYKQTKYFKDGIMKNTIKLELWAELRNDTKYKKYFNQNDSDTDDTDTEETNQNITKN